MPKDNESAPALTVNYGNEVVTLPASALARLKSASKKDIIILLQLLANPSAGKEELAALCDCSDNPSAVDTAIAFWRGAGVLGDSQSSVRQPSASKVKEAVTGLPNYTAADVTRIMEGNPALGKMLDEASRILGVFIGQADSMRLVSAIDYFGLEPEYMLLVCAHVARSGRPSVASVMRKVNELFDAGTVTVEALEERLLAEEKSGSLEQQVRALFGWSRGRALSDKEREAIERWSGEFGYDIDVIKMAFNITVDTIFEPSPGYTNAILKNWFDAGLKNAADVEAYLKKSKKEQKKTGESKSFDSDDFFNAALQRSMGLSGTAPRVSSAGSLDSRNFGVSGSRRKN